jgi:transcriptional regulator
MYIPSLFKESDTATIERFVDEHPLATVVLVTDGQPHVDHIPFMRISGLSPGGVLIAHVAKANNTWKLIDQTPSAMLVFTGASAYVSPSFYPSKPITHEVVPTWNYVGVHLKGKLSYSHDHDEKKRTVDHLTRKMEATRAEPWSIDDAPASYIAAMLSGVVALSFQIETIEAKFKASQNKTRKDRQGVIDGLESNSLTAEAAAIVKQHLDR